MSVRCLEGVWNVSGRCLECLWKVSRRELEFDAVALWACLKLLSRLSKVSLKGA